MNLKAPKQLIEEKPRRSRFVLALDVVIASEMIMVSIVYLLLPVLSNPDLVVWFNSQNLWTFFFGIFIPAILLSVVNHNFRPVPKEVVRVEEHRSEARYPVDSVRILPCYCCNQNKPITEMKLLLICKKCQEDQHVE